MRALGGLWRWRRNPLRRTTDLVEAWVALVATLLILVAAPVIGAVVGDVAQRALQRSVHDQQRSHRLVTATVVRPLKGNPVESDPDTTSAHDTRSRVEADWTAPDGSAHRGALTTALGSPHKGDHFAIWTDRQGRLVTRPLDAATATTHAVLAGFGAAMLAAAVVEGARRLIVWRLVRRRYARWDQAWDKAGPDWGRTGTGS
ncbi:hypothetical protein [Streptomyces mangrovisoli]|uniref:Transmembrane protein n=1 Tax=Streptomyces mangrovisoli TaxID=1428628 RepID=A0A1J4P1Q7_9ACTN|nr:hypothetical protein [Streptomyces mangrovisoli]OIJ68504.1 hypothetical protein WN71_006785 [Streptomyces mangrovisoli]